MEKTQALAVALEKRVLPPCDIHVHTHSPDQCDRTADYTFKWSWGQEGFVCGAHAPVITRLAAQLDQVVNLMLLHPPPPVLSKDESVQFLELQLVETKAAAANATAEVEQARAELVTLQGKLQGVEFERDQLKGQLDELVRQNAQLAARLADTKPPADPHVVEGGS